MKKIGSFFIFALIIMILAVAVRFVALDLKAMHHDEGVNYTFTKTLHDRFLYKYNPSAYHGPFLYFITLPVYALLGVTKFSLRFMPALFGCLAILLILLTRNVIGKKGALFAGLVMALSIVDIYYSRTFIHEIFLACGAAGLILCFMEYCKNGKTLHLFGIFFFTALCFTVKETTVLLLAAIAGAYVATRFVFWKMPGVDTDEDRLRIDWKGMWGKKLFLADAFAIAVTVWVLFFTSFLTYPHGIIRFFEAYMPWLSTGFEDSGHAKPPIYFFELAAKYYAPAILPAIITGFWSIKNKKPRGTFLFFMSLFLLAAYSVIPYKTPWCLMQMGLPIVLLAGYGISKALESGAGRIVKFHVYLYMLIAVLPYAYMSYAINFVDYDDDRYKIIYVQTDRSYEQLFQLLGKIADSSGQGNELETTWIYMRSPASFYLHDYKNVKRFRETPEGMLDDPLILVDSSLLEKVESRLMGEYLKLSYPIWPGTYVTLLAESNFYNQYAKEAP